MASDLLERLGESRVPPPPAEFDRQVHDRLNTSLLFAHLVEFGVQAIPRAAIHFSRALVGLVVHSLTGRYEMREKTKKSE